MQPPVCDVCGRRPDESARDDGFELVMFADHVPLPDGMTGHPQGVHWLCPKHAERGRDLAHLPWAKAARRIRLPRFPWAW